MSLDEALEVILGGDARRGQPGCQQQNVQNACTEYQDLCPARDYKLSLPGHLSPASQLSIRSHGSLTTGALENVLESMMFKKDEGYYNFLEEMDSNSSPELGNYMDTT